jgi:hypothetical protein
MWGTVDADNHKGTSSNRRQEAKEEVVKGQGYVISHRTHRAHPASPQFEAPAGSVTHNRRASWARLALASHDLAGLATNSRIVFDKQTNDKLQKDVQSYRLITVATLVDRLKINGSLARQALADLEANGQIKKVVGHSKLSIYSMSHHIAYVLEQVDIE